MDKLHIRQATSNDAQAVCRLHRQEWHDAFGDEYVYPENAEQRWRDALAAARSAAILAEENGIPIAMLVFRSTEQMIEITDLFVLQSHRRRAIASLLLDSLFNQTTGIRQFSLWVAESNTAARSLYEKLGFTETGECKTELRRRDSSPMIRLVSAS